MKTPQRAWFERPQRKSALALGFLGLVAAPGMALAQAAEPAAGKPAEPQAEIRVAMPAEAPAIRPVASVTLEEAIARALKTNPQVAQAAGTVTTSEAAERSAFGAYLPTLSANATGSLASSNRLDPETGAVTSGSSDTYSAGLSAGWDVFTGGQRSATRKQTRAQSNAAEAQLTAQQSTAVLDVERSFYEVLRAAGLEDVARSRMDGRGRTRRPPSAGRRWARRRARTCCARSWTSPRRARPLLTAQTPAHDGRRCRWGRLIGEDGPVDAKSTPEDLALKPLALTEDALVNEIVARAPSVLAAEASLRASEAGVGVAKSDYLPSVRLSAGYDWFNQDLAITGGRTSWSVRLGLSYPIFDGFLREERVVRAKTQASVSQVQLSDTRRAVQSGVGQSLGQLRLAEERITLAAESVEVAQEDLKVQQERYRLGATTILELLTSQENLVTAETNLVASRFDYRIARAELEALAGRKL
ncbi:TolC family protein [Pyxidicoccus sp. 3LG]